MSKTLKVTSLFLVVKFWKYFFFQVCIWWEKCVHAFTSGLTSKIHDMKNNKTDIYFDMCMFVQLTLSFNL